MTKRLITLFILIAAAFAQQPSPLTRVASVYVAANYGQWQIQVSTTNGHTGVGVLGLSTGQVSATDGSSIRPISTNAKLIVGTETVTVTATTCASVNPCTITGNFAAIHQPGDFARPASYGMSEAANAANVQGGGVVTVDNAWSNLGGSTSIITTSVALSNVVIMDNRGTLQVQYCYSGGLYVQCSGGVGGATFTPNAIQYATSTITARGATSSDVIGLFSGCSGSLVLSANGSCVASSGGSVTNTAGPLTPNAIAIGNGGNDLTVDSIATLDGSGNEVLTSSQTTGDGVHPGFISFSPNTTDNTLPASTFSISGPLVASMTAWALRFPGSVPASGLCFKTGTATAGGIVPVTFASCGGGGGTSTINLPVAVAQGAGGCSLGGSAPVGNLPACLLVAGTGTTTQRGNMQFCQSGPCTYTGVGGGTSTPYMDYNITMPSSGITSVTFGFRADTDTNNAHNAVWDFQYVCSAPSAVATGTLAAAQTATGALDGTTSHFLSAVLSAPTISGCAAGNLLQIRISLDASSTTTGNMNLISLQVIPQ
jgi:hypothetical protein